MKESSEIDDFLTTCETLVLQAQSFTESPKEFEETNKNLNDFFDKNWANFSALVTKCKHESKLDESFRNRVNALLNSLASLENKANTKNDWVNEFKQYILSSNQ